MQGQGLIIISRVHVDPGSRADPTSFQEFQQVRPASGAKHEGTGLGLALSRRLVELHHGTLAVESTLGRGSTFIARFPRMPK